jgi:hypothetical protein
MLLAVPTENGKVGFVLRELDRLATALLEPQPPNRYAELYAAQQALSWTLDPEHFASPLVTIQEGRIQPPTCTQGD